MQVPGLLEYLAVHRRAKIGAKSKRQKLSLQPISSQDFKWVRHIPRGHLLA